MLNVKCLTHHIANEENETKRNETKKVSKEMKIIKCKNQIMCPS
jgi:hypothetical protein